MRIGIELRQVQAGRSGGIVQLLQGVLPPLFELGREHSFVVYHTPDNVSLLAELPANVSRHTLEPWGFYRQLSAAAARDRLDVLFRTFPIEDPIAFPWPRQVVLVPDLQHEEMPECFSADVLARRRLAFDTCIDRAGAIAVLAEHGREVLRRRHPAACRDVFLLPPALPLDEATSAAPLDPAEESLVPSGSFFLFPANPWPHKNHRRLFEAFKKVSGTLSAKKVPDTFLVLTGDPSGWAEMQQHCGGLPVRHLGFVSPRLLAQLYRRATALTFFSLHEGFGIPLLEAFALGTPVVCSNTTSLPEIGGDAVLGCDPTNVEAMGEAMARIATDAELRSRLVANGRRRLSAYSWQQSSRNLLDACLRVGQAPIPASAVEETLAIMGSHLGDLETLYADAQRQLEQKDRNLQGVRAAFAELSSLPLHRYVARRLSHFVRRRPKHEPVSR